MEWEEEGSQEKDLAGHFVTKILVGKPRVLWEEMVKTDARKLLDVMSRRKREDIEMNGRR